MARRTKQEPLPDDFEEHILDTDIRDEMQHVVPGVRLLRHLLPGAARRARRPQAGAAPHPLHDGRDGPATRPRARQERSRRRRGHGPAAPARRRRDLRRPGPDGAAVVDAAADRRRARQLRLARRLPRRDALHRVPDGARRGRDDGLDRRGHRRLQAQLRLAARPSRSCCRPRSRTCWSTAPPASPSAWRPTSPRTTWSRWCRRCKHLITHPKATLDDLMRFIPGPDLPTGGKIVGLEGIRDAYESGPRHVPDARHGPDRVGHRAPQGHRGHRAALRRRHRARDGADQEARRWPRSCRASPTSRTSATASTACAWSSRSRTASSPRRSSSSSTARPPLEDSFGINAVALVDGQPRTLGLKEMLEVFLAHRFDVVRRRSTFRRKKAADRLHLVDGLLIAILDIDEVIQVIRGSRQRGRGQGAADRDLRALRRPGRLHPRHAAAPADQVLQAGAGEGEVRARAHDRVPRRDPRRREAAAEGRLRRARPTSPRSTARRAVPCCWPRPATPSPPPRSVEVADDPCFALLSSSGLLARTTSGAAPGQGEGRANHDVVIQRRTHHRPRRGRRPHQPRPAAAARRARHAASCPTRPTTPTSRAATRSASWSPSAPASAPLALTSLATDGPGLALGTRDGIVKRVNPEVLNRDEWEVIGLKEGDEVVGAVELVTGEEELVLHLLRRPAAPLPRLRRAPAGPRGRRHGRHQARRRASTVAFFGAFEPAERRRRHRVGLVDRPARHRGRCRQGDPVHASTPARAAPPAAYAATASSRARTRSSPPGPGPGPARAAASSGAPVDLPEANGRRDGSGVPAPQPIAAVASRLVASQVASQVAVQVGDSPTTAVEG